MQFEWDEGKNRINRIKHGISFELASLVFHDSYLMSVPDNRYDYDEERWQTIGAIDDVTIYVAHEVMEDENGEEIIRIISARATTPSEERCYYAYRRDEKRT